MSCKHQETEFRRYRIGIDGSERYYKTLQCLSCGKRLKNPGGGMWWKRDEGEDVSKLPSYDGDLENGNIEKEQAEKRERMRKERAEHKKKEEAEKCKEYLVKHEEYEEYIKTSPNWWEKRNSVMERCNFICEGCRSERATQVHHTNYDTLYNELLYSLKGLCGSCHKKAHGIVEKVGRPI